VLPRFHDAIRAVLTPEFVHVSRYRKGWKTSAPTRIRLLSKQNSDGIPDWQALVNLLEEYLQTACPTHVRLKIVISNSFTHYSVLPWMDGVASEKERQAYLRHHFLQTFGESAKEWGLALSRSGYGRAALGCGMSSEFLNSLKEMGAKAGAQLHSITPVFSDGFNFHRKSIRVADAWYAQLENGRFCLGLLQQGQWKKVRSLKSEGMGASELETLLDREIVLSGLEGSDYPVYVHSSGKKTKPFPTAILLPSIEGMA
jgi:hypothetical protein